MKPSRMQYFIADYGCKTAMASGALILAVVVGLSSERFSFWATTAVILALPLGCVLGFLFLSPIIGALACKVNGAPFIQGDVVHVLAGPHRDRIGQIYTIWTERDQVPVWLDEQAKREVTDVFSCHEICRECDDQSGDK